MNIKNLVSIIITTKNNAKTLEILLKSINKQSYLEKEIIVVDNNSIDSTVEVARKFTKQIYNAGPERSAQRNLGIKNSKGDYLFILDSDMILSKDVVKECVKMYMDDNKLGGIVIPEKSFGDNYWAKVKSFERELNEGESFFEAARFYPKQILKEFKGYDENLTGPEDWDLPRRVTKKYKIGRTKSYILHNEGKQSLIGLLKKKYYYGLSVHKFLVKNNIPLLSSTTVYFLRPAFYKNWQKLIKNLNLTVGLFIMLVAETIGGGLGYIMGRIKNE